jgi:hypothetical protein
MCIDIPDKLRDEDLATRLVEAYFSATARDGRSTLSGLAEAETGPKLPISSPPRTCWPSAC